MNVAFKFVIEGVFGVQNEHQKGMSEPRRILHLSGKAMTTRCNTDFL